jgi:hypothetical protein
VNSIANFLSAWWLMRLLFCSQYPASGYPSIQIGTI